MSIGGVSRTGNSRNNFLYGTQGLDTLDGGVGNDYLRGYAGDDVLTGGTGADRFVFERTFADNGTDRITDYIAGEDILDFSLVGFSRSALSQPLSSLIRLDYSADGTRLLIDLDGGGDSFQAWAILDGLELGDVADIRIGSRTVESTIAAFPPEILFFGASGPAQLAITANEAVVAQLYVVGSGTPGTPIGGTVNLSANVQGHLGVAAQGSVTVAELRVTDGAASATASNMVYLGTGGNDTISASSAADIIFAFGGSDVITGGAGADTVYAGVGNDTINGAAGDMLYGEAGNDSFSFDEGAGVTVASAAGIVGGADTDEVLAWTGIGGGNVTLGDAAFANASGLEVLRLSAGGTGTVTLGVNANAAFASGVTVTNAILNGALVVHGAAAGVAITATGGNAADSLTGGSQNDTLTGGNGNDTLTGGGGSDTLTGGIGSDVIFYTSAAQTASGSTAYQDMDVLEAFSTADRINISALTGYTVSATPLQGSWDGATFTPGTAGTDDDYILSWTNGPDSNHVILKDTGYVQGLLAEQTAGVVSLQAPSVFLSASYSLIGSPSLLRFLTTPAGVIEDTGPGSVQGFSNIDTWSVESIKTGVAAPAAADYTDGGLAQNYGSPNYFIRFDAILALDMYLQSWEDDTFTTTDGGYVKAGSFMYVGGLGTSVAVEGRTMAAMASVNAGDTVVADSTDTLYVLGGTGSISVTVDDAGTDVFSEVGDVAVTYTLGDISVSVASTQVFFGFDTGADLIQLDPLGSLATSVDDGSSGTISWLTTDAVATTQTASIDFNAIEAVEILKWASFITADAGLSTAAMRLNGEIDVSAAVLGDDLLLLATDTDSNESMLLYWREDGVTTGIQGTELTVIGVFDEGHIRTTDIALLVP